MKIEITPNKILMVFGLLLLSMPIACLGATAQENLMATIDNVTNLIVTISIGFAIMMYVIGGFLYMTSGGTKSLDTGKNIILYTTIGLVIILAAKVIANVVTSLVAK